MTDLQYAAAKSQLVVLCCLAREIDLAGMLGRIEEADAAGPVLDPTLYRMAAPTMQRYRSVATAALVFQRVAADEGVGQPKPMREHLA